ncbi:MAG: type IV pilus secretin PilQ [Myxococcota bacterium]|nr:type IV pilus secretin PilQ [Myxococcota bacterium]
MNQITSITVEEGPETTEIIISGSKKPTFSADKLETTPARLLINISNAEFNNVPASIEVENGVISMITMQQQSDDLVRIGRIIIGLDRNVPFNVEVRGTQLVVVVDGRERTRRVADEPGPSAQALRDAIARAEAAEQRAKSAEEQARAAAQNADARVAAAEANARASEVKALKAAEDAQLRANESDRQARAAEQRAARLAQEAAAAQQSAQSATAETASIRTASRERAEKAEARAKAAEALAQASRIEARAAANAANAQIAAANAKTKEAEAQVKAAEARENASRSVADGETEKAQTLARAATQAQQEARTATAQLEAARAQLQEVQRQADEAERRAQTAEGRAQTAEGRAQQAERRAVTAEGRAQQAEAKAAQAEQAAKQAAVQAQDAARRAEQRAVAAEQRSRQLESAAQAANQEADRLSAQLAQSTARSQDQAQLESALAKAQEDAAAADERSKAAQREATAAQTAADAQLAAAKSRASVAEARSRAAEARANAAETKTRDAEQLAQTRAAQADELSKAAAAAEQRAARAQADLQRANAQLDATEKRNQRLELEVVAAQRQVQQAETNVRNAQNAAQRSEAEAQLAQSKIVVAQTQARAAEERASAAAARASDAEQTALVARRNAQRVRANVSSQADERQAQIAEADARAAAAEARAQRLEAERARLAQENQELQTQKVGTTAAILKLEAEKRALDEDLAAARRANDESAQQLVRAKQRVQSANVAVEEARAAQISSAQAVSSLKGRVKVLEQDVAVAESKQQVEKVSKLNQKLAEARQRIGRLEASLDSNQQALVQAQAKAEQRRADIRQLKADLEAAAAQKAPQPTPAVAPATATVSTPTAPPPVVAPAAKPVAAAAPPAAKPVTTPAPTLQLPPPPPLMRTRITDVQFTENQDHSAVTIVFQGPPARYTLKKEGNRTQILELDRALIDPAIERSLDTTEFRGAVQLVSSFQAPPPGDRVRVVVTLNQDVKGQLVPDKQTLVWRFRMPPASARMVTSLPPAPRWQGQSPMEVPTAASKAAVYTGMGQSIATRRESKKRPVRRKRYTGRKINIDIKDGDIHNILRLLAKEGNVNIVTSDDVKGAVTMHLKLVPWDQALEIILRTKGLDMVREGDIIRVAPTEMIAKEREAELKKQEVKEKLKPLEVKLITVNHADASQLMPRVKSVLSKRGSSQFDTRTNTVILKDVDDHLDAAEDIIRRLDTQTPQVLIETRIVEVNEVNVNQLGIQWGMDSTFSAATGNPTGLRFPSTVGISGGADDQQQSNEGVSSNPNFVVNLPASSGLGSGGALGMTFGSIDSTFNLNIRLSALENRGSVKIVSSPKITTLDNKQATISQGVSIPISQVSAAGIQTVFFDAVLSLEATPHVTQDGNIYLKLRAENNTPDFQNVGARGDPTILKKEAVTELLLKDGDTTVIGGIYTSNAGFNRSEVPYLARIPILGAFFRNHQESDRRSELLIFVTPRIVNRAASKVRTAP